MKLILTLILCAPALVAIGCGSTRYGDARAQETVNVDWGSTDLQTFADHMVESIVDSPAVAYKTGPGKGEDARPIVYMGGVRNETTEHVNTGGVTDSIRTSLIKTGRFRFVAGDKGQSEIGDQVRFQQGSGRVDPEMAKAFGAQLGADFVIYGTLRSIVKRKDGSISSGGVRTKDVYYQFVLNCVDIKTGEILWANEEEIRKTAKKGIFG